MTVTKTRIGFRPAAIILSLCMAFLAGSTWAQSGEAESQTLENLKIIERISQSVHNVREVESILSELGFNADALGDSAITATDFAALPDAHKLRLAYLSTNASEPGSGDTLLREVMLATAKRNVEIIVDPIFVEAIVKNNDFVDIVGSGQELANSVNRYASKRVFSFGTPSNETLAEPLPSEARRIIRSIVIHTPRTPSGMIEAILACCGLGAHEAMELLLKERTIDAVLERAIRDGTIPESIALRISELIQHSRQTNYAVEFDDVIQELLNDASSIEDHPNPFGEVISRRLIGLSEQATEIDPVSIAVQEIAGDSPPPALNQLSQAGIDVPSTKSHNAARGAYSSFVARSYNVWPTRNDRSPGTGPASGGGLSFAAVTKSAGGFGGVVLGSEITSETPAAPVYFEWYPTEVTTSDTDERLGVFIVEFDDQSHATTSLIRETHAFAAIRAVFDGVPGVINALDTENRDAVGLVGYLYPDRGPPAGRDKVLNLESGVVTVFSTDRDLERKVARFVVHPAITGLQLSDDALLLDALPFMTNLIPQLSVLQPGLQSWQPPGRGTYKFTDVPTSVWLLKNNVLQLRRTVLPDDLPTWSTELREVSFIGFQAYRYSDQRQLIPMPTEVPPFYEQTPLLIDACPNFRRLNEFSQVLAYLRWLKTEGAERREEMPIVELGPSFTTLIREGNSLTLDLPQYSLRQELINSIRVESNILLGPQATSLSSVLEPFHDSYFRVITLIEARERFGQVDLGNDASSLIDIDFENFESRLRNELASALKSAGMISSKTQLRSDLVETLALVYSGSDIGERNALVSEIDLLNQEIEENFGVGSPDPEYLDRFLTSENRVEIGRVRQTVRDLEKTINDSSSWFYQRWRAGWNLDDAINVQNQTESRILSEVSFARQRELSSEKDELNMSLLELDEAIIDARVPRFEELWRLHRSAYESIREVAEMGSRR